MPSNLISERNGGPMNSCDGGGGDMVILDNQPCRESMASRCSGTCAARGDGRPVLLLTARAETP